MLPQNDVKNYTITLPISGLKHTFRPYQVREQKILYIALETTNNDEKEMVSAMQQVMSNCSITPLDFNKLPIVDFEYLFLQLRSKSVGEDIQLKYRCKLEKEPGKPCDNIEIIPLNLEKIEVTPPNKKDNVIQLSDNPLFGIEFNYPSVSLMQNLSGKNIKDFNITEELIISCIKSVFDAKNVYSPEQYSKDEFKQWLEELTLPQYQKIEEFFYNIPKIKTDLQFVCRKCGNAETIHLEGVESFFG